MKRSPIDPNVFLIVGGKDETYQALNSVKLFFYFERMYIPVNNVHVPRGIELASNELTKVENHHCNVMYNKKISHSPFLLFGGTNTVYVNQLIKISVFHGEFLTISTLKNMLFHSHPNDVFADVQFIFDDSHKRRSVPKRFSVSSVVF